MGMEEEEAKGKKKREQAKVGGGRAVGSDGQPIKRLHLIIK